MEINKLLLGDLRDAVAIAVADYEGQANEEIVKGLCDALHLDRNFETCLDDDEMVNINLAEDEIVIIKEICKNNIDVEYDEIADNKERIDGYRAMIAAVEPDAVLVPKGWHVFRNCGLLGFINMFLHMFGWAITMHVDKEGRIIDCFPCRTKFRGFDNNTTESIYRQVSDFMAANALQLKKEANS